MADVDNLVATINPDSYVNREDLEDKGLNVSKFKELIKKEGIVKAVKEAKPEFKPVWSHKLVYDLTASAPLEPVYFWILDFMRDLGFKTEKMIDNFTASPGSGYFADLVGRQTKMQEEGMKIMGTIGAMVRSLVNLLYDMREFEIRLKQYDLIESKKPEEKEAGILGLKQIWMDKVDMQRGKGSINAMGYELGFATLRDAFMTARSVEQVDRMDLNDRVKRVLKPRLADFFAWKESSEKELRKRFEVEKSWIRSQVGNIKLYSRWAKPYLKAAEELKMKEKVREPDLVKAFQMILLELCLLGRKKINIKNEVDEENLPKAFRNLKLKRDYYSCILIDFGFRGIPAKGLFSGRADVSFKSFALNEDELKALDKAMTKSDFEDALKMVESVTDESLKQLTDDIEHFLGKEEKEEEKEKEKAKKTKAAEKEKNFEPGKESYEESVIRQLAEQKASASCFKIYNIYKKAHGMASLEEPEWAYPPKWRVAG